MLLERFNMNAFNPAFTGVEEGVFHLQTEIQTQE